MSKIKEETLQLEIPFDETFSKFTKVGVALPYQSEEYEGNATPFVKWAGGKRSIMSELVARMPNTFNDYYEPFVGGGAVFFEIHKSAQNCYLSDINLDLVITYNIIKKDPQELIKLLKIHAQSHNEEYYYQIRSKHSLLSPVEIAARFLYLNKTCFNGLFRVNKKGEFNVPIGKYKNPNIIQENNILSCHDLLQNIEIEYREFDSFMPKKGDFVYLDPPYHPIDEHSFTSYTKLDFTEKDQIRLRDFCNQLNKNGVYFMLSNSDAKFIKDIYKGYNIQMVLAPRYVNCKPTKRNAVQEVLITNYTICQQTHQ